MEDGSKFTQIEPVARSDPPLFASYFLGGFESSTLRRKDGQQLDLLAATGHDRFAGEDYAQLRRLGIHTVRDALRWHLIERRPYLYDWSSFLPMLQAATEARVQVIWDICHYGTPADVDVWSPAFVDRFAAFAGSAAALVRNETGGGALYCVMNEISFWSWAGGDMGWLAPCGIGRGHELKRQLIRAAIAATEEIRRVDPLARLIQAEPVINIVADPERPEATAAAEEYRRSQFEAWDMLAGRICPEIGGREEYLDIVGVNFYWNNQWIDSGMTLGLGHPLYRPFSQLLAEVYERYRRPMVVSETGAEEPNGAGWLRYVGGEVRVAIDAGVPVEGICIYPVMDYLGWDDDRHCHCGLIHVSDDWGQRRIRAGMFAQLEREQTAFAECADGRATSLVIPRTRDWPAPSNAGRWAADR
jgi:hypothetical protein